jgi:peptide/nickel transport system ATP-binding protein
MSVPVGLSGVETPEPVAAPIALVARRSPLALRLGVAGGALLLLLVAVAVLAPVLARHDPSVPSGLPYQAPSLSHPLGTNDVGQDLFAQLLHGSRISLAIGVSSALVAITVGLAVALVAGYHRGRLDGALMRVVDLTLAFPFLVLVIVLAAFFGRGLVTTILVIAAVIWARPARVLRSQVLKVREYQHVTAARAMGATDARCICRHVLPRIAPLAAAQFVRAANVSVLLEASLSFLGLGDPNRVSWGTMLFFANARNAFLTDAWLWWILPPGLALTAAILGFAFLGYAVEELTDPRLSRTAPRHGRRRRRVAPAIPSEAAGGSGPARAEALEVRDLTIEYGGADPVRAVDGVTFTVGAGRVVGLVGESGSGKTTLVMALLGLLRSPGRVVEGSAMVSGRDLGRLRRSEVAAIRGRQVALIPQNAMNALNPAYTVHRQVTEAAALTREPATARRRATEVLESVGIPDARHGAYPHELSGGMRQRVVIAMAIANRPALLVADEPVTGLDVVTQARVLRLLLELRDSLGLAILLISHDLPLVARVADELLVMHEGRIVERGEAQAVTTAPTHPYTRRLVGAFPALRGPRRRSASVSAGPAP